MKTFRSKASRGAARSALAAMLKKQQDKRQFPGPPRDMDRWKVFWDSSAKGTYRKARTP